MRMARGFASKVSSIKLLEGSVDVVQPEHHVRRDPLVGVDLGDNEQLGGELPVPQVTARGTHMGKGEALPTGRDDSRRYVRPSLSQGLQVCNHDSATVPEPDAHHAIAIVDATVDCEDLGHRRPIARSEVREEAVICPACRVFEPWRLWLQFLKAGEGGVEVLLVK